MTSAPVSSRQPTLPFNYSSVRAECIYQSILRRLGRLPPIVFGEALDLRRLLVAGIRKFASRRTQRLLVLRTSDTRMTQHAETDNSLAEENGNSERVGRLDDKTVQACLDRLVRHRHLLCDYFSITIVPDQPRLSTARRPKQQKRSRESKRLKGEGEREKEEEREDSDGREEAGGRRQVEKENADKGQADDRTTAGRARAERMSSEKSRDDIGHAKTVTRHRKKRKSTEEEEQEEKEEAEPACCRWLLSSLPLCIGSYVCVEKLPRLVLDLVTRVRERREFAVNAARRRTS